MYRTYSFWQRCSGTFLLCCLCSLLLLLNACGQSASSSSNGHPSSSSTTVTQPVTSPTGIVTEEAAQTCPTEEKARAAVMPSIAVGTHATIVYLSQDANSNSRLQRYDTVTGTSQAILQTGSDKTLSSANISSDGEWILLVSLLQGQSAIQLIRIDGQHLQTLYCAPAQMSIDNALLSPDNSFIVFNQADQNDMSVLYLLDVRSGTLRTEISPFQPGFQGVIPPLQASNVQQMPYFAMQVRITRNSEVHSFEPVPSTHYLIYIPMRWAGNSVYLLGTMHASPAPFPRLALLRNIHKDVTQQQSNVQMYATSTAPDGNPCFDYDETPDNSQALCSAYTLFGPPNPTTLTLQVWNGGTPRVVYSNPAGGRIVARFLSNTSILFIMNDRNGPPALWKINTDGSGLTRLIIAQSTDVSIGFAYSSYLPWSITSRDGRLYALEVSNVTSNTQSLMIGSLTGGSPRVIASNTNSLLIVGWTEYTM